MPRTSKTAGIACDACGSCDLRVVRTVPAIGHVTRRLKCRACGERTTTVERSVSDAPPAAGAIGAGLLSDSIGQLLQSIQILQNSTSQPKIQS